jgi:hypothetical protein
MGDLLNELSTLVAGGCLSAGHREIGRLFEQYSLICEPGRPVLDLLNYCFGHYGALAVYFEAAAMCICRSGRHPKLLTNGSISHVIRARIPSSALQLLRSIIAMLGSNNRAIYRFSTVLTTLFPALFQYHGNNQLFETDIGTAVDLIVKAGGQLEQLVIPQLVAKCEANPNVRIAEWLLTRACKRQPQYQKLLNEFGGNQSLEKVQAILTMSLCEREVVDCLGFVAGNFAMIQGNFVLVFLLIKKLMEKLGGGHVEQVIQGVQVLLEDLRGPGEGLKRFLMGDDVDDCLDVEMSLVRSGKPCSELSPSRKK